MKKYKLILAALIGVAIAIAIQVNALTIRKEIGNAITYLQKIVLSDDGSEGGK